MECFIPACSRLLIKFFFKKGSTKVTNLLKCCVWCLCNYVCFIKPEQDCLLSLPHLLPFPPDSLCLKRNRSSRSKLTPQHSILVSHRAQFLVQSSSFSPSAPLYLLIETHSVRPTSLSLMKHGYLVLSSWSDIRHCLDHANWRASLMWQDLGDKKQPQTEWQDGSSPHAVKWIFPLTLSPQVRVREHLHCRHSVYDLCSQPWFHQWFHIVHDSWQASFLPLCVHGNQMHQLCPPVHLTRWLLRQPKLWLSSVPLLSPG